MSFDETVLSEQECIAKSRSEEKGCCVSGNECKFSSRASCSSSSLVLSGNSTGEGFYPGMLCSNDKLNCDCAKQQKTGCVPGFDEVFWFDSCGNMENIYSSDKVASYNNGYVLPKDDSCNLKSPNDPSCGNCDYSSGTICGAAPKDVNVKFGNFVCRDVNCDDVFKDFVSPNSGAPKKNGESWCIYDTFPGMARDAVGSRHFRHVCANGEEFVEPCRDFREEICIQGLINNKPASSASSSFAFSGDYVEAACRDNRWEDCFSCNSMTSCGGDCSDQGPECCVKKCCQESSVRDCFFLQAGITSTGSGVCVPDVPPGFVFWGAEPQAPSSSTRSAETQRLNVNPLSNSSGVTGAAVSTASGLSTIRDVGSSAPGSGVCSQANQECAVTWHRGGVSRIFSIEDWKCVGNCHCTKSDWVVAGNNLCKAMGDCGAYFNILGKITLDGYANSASAERKWFQGYKLKESDVGDWSALSRPGSDKQKKASGILSGGKFGEFFGKAGFALGIMVAEGVYTGYSSDWTKGSFTSGATGGLKTIGNSIGWLFKLGKAPASSIVSNWGTTYGTQTISAGYLPKGSIVSGSELQKLLGEKTIQDLEEKKAVEWVSSESGKGATYKVLDGKALGEVSGESLTVQNPMISNTMGALNTIMWVYTIYELVDVFLAQDKSQNYMISCSTWVAPDGGADCEKCNKDNNNKPCSLYRCKSLGKLCSLINEGTSEEKCVSLHPNDVNSPVIKPWSDVLTKGLTLSEVTAESNKGFKVDQKVKPYQSITLGIKTDEPSQCKFDSEHSVDFDKKLSFFGDQIFKYEHQITFSLPADLTTPEALKSNKGVFNIYLRCKDASGNKNNKDYFIRFVIGSSSDLTAPVIERTSVEKDAYAPSGINDTYFSVYINEPGECRWSLNDTDFNLMVGKFACVDSGFSLSSVYYGLYECKTTLPLALDGSTDYYFRCKDKAGNFNTESYLFSLRSSDPLLIDSVSPSGSLYTSDVGFNVVTSGGAYDGVSRCGYSDFNVPFLSMIEFFETNSALHKQTLTLDKGSYTYFMTCRDIAGNEASSNTTFVVDVDLVGPSLSYIYSEGSVLHLESTEPSNCQYSANSTISYGFGLPMSGSDSLAHELTISNPVYYISCIDSFKNEAKYTVYL